MAIVDDVDASDVAPEALTSRYTRFYMPVSGARSSAPPGYNAHVLYQTFCWPLALATIVPFTFSRIRIEWWPSNLILLFQCSNSTDRAPYMIIEIPALMM